MVRGLVVMMLMAGAFAVGLYARDQDGLPTFEAAKKAAPPVRQQSCEDDCEQAAIVVGTRDTDARACKARCKGKEAAAAPREVPSRITVAPADHRGGLEPAPERRISRAR